MEFKYSQKEVYEPKDIEEILGQHFTFVKKQVKSKQENKWNSKLTEAEEALKAKDALIEERNAELKTVTEERENLNAKVESLETEITPFRTTALENKFSGLLKGKVLETATSDVLASLDLSLETTEEEATEALDKLLESKPYFKPVIESENNEAIKNGKINEENGAPVRTGMNISFNGEE